MSTRGWRAQLLPAYCGGLQTPSCCCVLWPANCLPPPSSLLLQRHLAVHNGRPFPNLRAKMAEASRPTGGSVHLHLVHAAALDGAVEPLHPLAAAQLVLQQLASAEQMIFKCACTAALVCRLCKAGQRQRTSGPHTAGEPFAFDNGQVLRGSVQATRERAVSMHVFGPQRRTSMLCMTE